MALLFYRWADALVFGAVKTVDWNPTKEYGGAVIVAICCLGVLSEPRICRIAMKWIAIVTLVALLLQLGYEWGHPGVFSHLSHNVSGRSGGWFGNSNTP